MSSQTPKGNHAKKGYPQPRKKWDVRCSVCSGTGEVYWNGWIRCEKCEGRGVIE